MVGLLIIFPRNNCFTSIECEEVAPVGCVITGTAAGAGTGTTAGANGNEDEPPYVDCVA